VVDEQGCTVCTLVEGEGDMEGGGRRWHRGEWRRRVKAISGEERGNHVSVSWDR
jgi:hypothetical protein